MQTQVLNLNNKSDKKIKRTESIDIGIFPVQHSTGPLFLRGHPGIETGD